MKKNIKWIVIIFFVSIFIETCIYLYNNLFIYKLYSHFHFINNETINLNVENLNFESINDYYEIMKLNISNNIKIYNVKLIFKERFDNNLYVRVRSDYGDKLLPKSNYPTTEFKTYYKDGINTSNLEIVFPKKVVNINDIKSIQINSNLQYIKNIKFSVIRVIVYFIIIILVYFIVNYKTFIINKFYSFKLENLFTFCIMLFSIIYLFVNAPLDRYDEHGHVLRAYELSTGKIKTDPGNEFPISIIKLLKTDDGIYPNRDYSYNFLLNKLHEPLNPNSKITYSAGSTGGYSVVNYFAVTIGVFLARIIQLNPLLIFYIGRFFNILMYTIVVYFALKLCPNKKFKTILGVISIFPMSINLAASFSPDTVINGFTILGLAYFLKLRFGENIREINLKQIIILTTFILIPVICKVVYILLFGLILFIPKYKLKRKHSNIFYFCFALIISVCLYFVFNILLKGNVESSIEPNPIEQMIFCISNPLKCVKILVNTLDQFSTTYLIELVGGWNTTSIISIIWFIILILITFEYDPNSNRYSFTRVEKLCLISIAVLETIAVFAGLYICWSTAQAPYVIGIQGRYFLPIIPIILLFLNNNYLKINIKNKRIKFFTFVVITYVITIIHSILSFI